MCRRVVQEHIESVPLSDKVPLDRNSENTKIKCHKNLSPLPKTSSPFSSCIEQSETDTAKCIWVWQAVLALNLLQHIYFPDLKLVYD